MYKEIVAIARVSTDKQDVVNQHHQVEIAFPNCQIHWFNEVLSGSTPNADRPEFIKATKLAKKLGCPIVAANLSRFGRDLAEVSTWYRDNVLSGKQKMIALDYPNLEPDTAGIFFTIQQMESLKISQRTKAAHARQKAEIQANGFFISKAGQKIYSLGNGCKKASDLGNAKIRAKADSFAANNLPLVQSLQSTGKSLKDIAVELNDRGIKTARGGDWYASTVSNLLRRAA
jgi:DNA invertase Pin-like site-specific DNA recombinase